LTGAYESAVSEFDAALQLSSGQNATAANNRAACLLYTGRLAEAIAGLEETVRADPPRNTTAAVVTNLSVLYQMTEKGEPAKAALQALVGAIGSEELDLTVLQPATA
jgi:tetratricopeptide (TPR) repeat protein